MCMYGMRCTSFYIDSYMCVRTYYSVVLVCSIRMYVRLYNKQCTYTIMLFL